MLRTLALAVLLLPTLSAAAAAPPTVKEAVAKMIVAAGGAESFAALGIVTLEVAEEEVTAGGQRRTSRFTAQAAAAGLNQLRVEMSNGVVIARNGRAGWATIDGKPDERPQTSTRAVGTCNQRLFPLLLPFSLEMEGVLLGGVEASTWEGKPAWALTVDFGKGFFSNPVMGATWRVFASRADWSLLGASFQPPAEYAEVVSEGVRYRILNTQQVGGVELPRTLLMEGIGPDGAPNGHNRTVEIAAAQRAWDLTLFLDPATRQEIEDEDDILDPIGR